MTRLSDIRVNQKIRIVKINGSRESIHRIMELGIIPGQIIIISKKVFGIFIIRCYGSQIAISESLANEIEVQEL